MKEMMNGMVKDAVKEAIKGSPGGNSRPSVNRPSLASLIKPSLTRPNSQKPSEGQRPVSGSTKPFPLSGVSSPFHKFPFFIMINLFLVERTVFDQTITRCEQISFPIQHGE